MPSRLTLFTASRGMSRLAAAVLLAAVLGCDSGTPLGQVSGVVTYDGQPLQDAEVEFIPLDQGKSSIGFTDENGKYYLQYTLNRTGALIGKHKVSVRVNPAPGAPAVPIPRKYGAKSELEYEVTAGTNEYAIRIESAD